MRKKVNKYVRRLIRHIRKTYKNKLAAIALILFGWFLAKVTRDGTFFALVTTIGLCMFVVDWDVFSTKD